MWKSLVRSPGSEIEVRFPAQLVALWALFHLVIFKYNFTYNNYAENILEDLP